MGVAAGGASAPPPHAASARTQTANAAKTILRRREEPVITIPSSPVPGKLSENKVPEERPAEDSLTSPRLTTVMVAVVGESPTTTVSGLKEQLTPFGKFEHDKPTSPEKPFPASETCTARDFPRPSVSVAGETLRLGPTEAKLPAELELLPELLELPEAVSPVLDVLELAELSDALDAFTE